MIRIMIAGREAGLDGGPHARDRPGKWRKQPLRQHAGQSLHATTAAAEPKACPHGALLNAG